MKKTFRLMAFLAVMLVTVFAFGACSGGKTDWDKLKFWEKSKTEETDGEQLGSGGGKSAYDIAVENGFEGTVTEWLDSLKGADGIDGQDGTSGGGVDSPFGELVFSGTGEFKLHTAGATDSLWVKSESILILVVGNYVKISLNNGGPVPTTYNLETALLTNATAGSGNRAFDNAFVRTSVGTAPQRLDAAW